MKSTYVINLLLLLFHSKFQKVKNCILHTSIHSQHNDRLKDVTQSQIILYFAWVDQRDKVHVHAFNHKSNLYAEYVNNNECKVTTFNLKFTHGLASVRSSTHIVQLHFHTLVSLPSRLPLIVMMMKIHGKDTASKLNQYTQQLPQWHSGESCQFTSHLLAVFIKLRLANSQFSLFA